MKESWTVRLPEDWKDGTSIYKGITPERIVEQCNWWGARLFGTGCPKDPYCSYVYGIHTVETERAKEIVRDLLQQFEALLSEAPLESVVVVDGIATYSFNLSIDDYEADEEPKHSLCDLILRLTHLDVLFLPREERGSKPFPSYDF